MIEGLVSFALSKHGMELLKAGVARLGPGGLKDIATGRMIEMVKPVLQIANKANPLNPLSTFNLVTSLASEGYSAYKLNKMDGKLDGMIRSLSEITKAVGSIQTVEILQFATVGLQLANVAVTAVGFYLTMKKLDEIGGELRAFYDRYREDKAADEKEKYQSYMGMVSSHMGYLQMRYETDIFDERDFLFRSSGIEHDCNQIYSFLQKILQQFMSHKIDHALACQIIFTLGPAFAELVSEYCCQYRCYLGKRNPQFDNWCGILKQINSESFILFLQQEMAFNPYYLELSPEQRHNALVVCFGSIAKCQEMLAARDKVLEGVPARSPITVVDELLNLRAWQTLGREMGAGTEETISEMLTQSVLNTDIPENGAEHVFIPVHAMEIPT